MPEYYGYGVQFGWGLTHNSCHVITTLASYDVAGISLHPTTWRISFVSGPTPSIHPTFHQKRMSISPSFIELNGILRRGGNCLSGPEFGPFDGSPGLNEALHYPTFGDVVRETLTPRCPLHSGEAMWCYVCLSALSRPRSLYTAETVRCLSVVCIVIPNFLFK